MLGHNNGARDSPMTTVKKAAETVVHKGHKATDSVTEGARHLEKKAENALHSGRGHKAHGGGGGAVREAKRTVENRAEEVGHRVEETFDAGGRKTKDMAHVTPAHHSTVTPAHHSTPAHQSHGGVMGSVKDGAVKIKEKVFGK